MNFEPSARRQDLLLFFAFTLVMPLLVYATVLPGYVQSIRFGWMLFGTILHFLLFAVFVIFGSRWLLRFILLPWCFLSGAAVVADLFLWLHFTTFFNADVLSLIVNTNPQEATGFGRIFLFSPSTLFLLSAFPASGAMLLLPTPPRIRRTLSAMLFVLCSVCAAFFSPNDPTAPPPGCGQRIDDLILHLLRSRQKPDLDKVNCDIIAANSDREAVYVLVIGESHSRRHSSLYGYPRNNMPLLGKYLSSGNFFRFNDVVSPHSLTMLALPKLLSFEAHGGKSFSECHNVIDIFRKAGFKTWYLTNQPPPNENVSYFDIARRAEIFRFESDGINVRDGKLADSLQDILRDDPVPKKFVILHLAGSHWPYENKCPLQYRLFSASSDCEAYTAVQRKNKSLINSYDNSLVYTDHVLDRIFRRIAESGKNGFVLYLPDHGEALYEDGIHCGHTEFLPLPETVEVPMLLFLSDRYMNLMPRQKLQALRRAVNMPWSSEDLPFLLIDLARIDYPGFIPDRSPFNPAFTPRKRIISAKGTSYETLKQAGSERSAEF